MNNTVIEMGGVAIKLHTGEKNDPNILPREMVKAFQTQIPDSAKATCDHFGKRIISVLEKILQTGSFMNQFQKSSYKNLDYKKSVC